ncbi:hypothetical protein SG0102_01040 [Intestinibaculum porci]|uniref:Uncharacterized protein n=1 Tax=Intestinibaculum porci TaxID=2487118 RepID=A0A3G9J1W1_9FIRM|nr:hypothetical protein SG0102_01040 [Intestinibaculum porci]
MILNENADAKLHKIVLAPKSLKIKYTIHPKAPVILQYNKCRLGVLYKIAKLTVANIDAIN